MATGAGVMSMASNSQFTIVDEALAVADACRAANVDVRILGGVAVALHCPPAPDGSWGHRRYDDIDLYLPSRRHAAGLRTVLAARGYAPDGPFNALNGQDRLIFHSDNWKVDVFVKDFKMCHVIPLAGRMGSEWPTISATDLLLTKLQVVEFTDKDRTDAEKLLESHDVSREEGDVINAAYLAELASKDWGIHTTVTENLSKIVLARPFLAGKIAEIVEEVDRQPKTLGFKARAKLGKRKRWYQEPEESER